jgi:hypothetical protein
VTQAWPDALFSRQFIRNPPVENDFLASTTSLTTPPSTFIFALRIALHRDLMLDSDIVLPIHRRRRHEIVPQPRRVAEFHIGTRIADTTLPVLPED